MSSGHLKGSGSEARSQEEILAKLSTNLGLDLFDLDDMSEMLVKLILSKAKKKGKKECAHDVRHTLSIVVAMSTVVKRALAPAADADKYLSLNSPASNGYFTG